VEPYTGEGHLACQKLSVGVLVNDWSFAFLRVMIGSIATSASSWCSVTQNSSPFPACSGILSVKQIGLLFLFYKSKEAVLEFVACQLCYIVSYWCSQHQSVCGYTSMLRWSARQSCSLHHPAASPSPETTLPAGYSTLLTVRSGLSLAELFYWGDRTL